MGFFCRFLSRRVARAWAWAGGTLGKPPTSEAAHRGGAAYDRGNGGRRALDARAGTAACAPGGAGPEQRGGRGAEPRPGPRTPLTVAFRGHLGQKRGALDALPYLFIYICLIMQHSAVKNHQIFYSARRKKKKFWTWKKAPLYGIMKVRTTIYRRPCYEYILPYREERSKHNCI